MMKAINDEHDAKAGELPITGNHKEQLKQSVTKRLSIKFTAQLYLLSRERASLGTSALGYAPLLFALNY